MQPRTYALAAIAAGAGMFFALVATNLIIDPQGMFGTGLLPRTVNANERYERFAAYQAAPRTYDGLMFGSSRAKIMPLDELSRRMDGAKFAGFAVAGGMLSDHLPVLEFIAREKMKLGERIRAVVLLIDIDVFGTPPQTNLSIQMQLPPPLTGEHPVRFWWRYLTAIQFRTWGSVMREAHEKSHSAEAPKTIPARIMYAIAAAVTEAARPFIAHAKPGSDAAESLARPGERISDRSDFKPQIALLQRFVTLCRQQGAELIVAITPLHPAKERLFEPGNLSDAVELIGRVVPVWDFTGSYRLLDRPDLWRTDLMENDTSHFGLEVAHMMVARMFGDDVPEPWKHFGRLRSGGGQVSGASAGPVIPGAAQHEPGEGRGK
jgi:hypothetical protein